MPDPDGATAPPAPAPDPPRRAEVPVGAVSQVSGLCRPSDVVLLAFRAAQVDGREPFVHCMTFDRPLAPDDVLPEGARIERSLTSDSERLVLARCPVGRVLVTSQATSVQVEVSAPTEEEAAAIAEGIRRRTAAVPPEGTVRIRCWSINGYGAPDDDERDLEVPTWADIAANYPRAVRTELERLVTMGPPGGGGKLIVFHGEPGTGKTTAIRALMERWAGWCRTHYVADPEELFARPSYLTEVLTEPDPPSGSPSRPGSGPAVEWRLIVAEDLDQFLDEDNPRSASGALARLLNVSDGVLGQGFRALVLLTTNDERHLHPALLRPGRCLARVAFTRFPLEEARRWLPDGHQAPTEPPTLAELFAVLADPAQARHVGRGVPGQYL